MVSSSRYELYRYYNPDGSSKDWAVRNNGNGTYTKRWGKTGTRLQSRDFPLNDPNIFWKEKQAKQRKGYILVGEYFIDNDGNLSTVPPVSPAPVANPPNQEQEGLRIYWRIKIPEKLVGKPVLEFFRGQVRAFAQAVIEAYPSCEWVIAINSRYRDISFVKSEAGSFLKEDGVGPLLLLMALKKAAPDGISITLSHDDQVEISHKLRLEGQALSFFGSDLESVRETAEMIGLLDKRLDLAMVESNVGNYYF
jgi:hypothetical protein